ncbi:MAG: host attachment protein [Gammaproteobacteria bacterium]|nr:host attachment protein [Gammaproteobacteria bacterium]
MDSRQKIRLPNASTCIAVCSAKGARFWHSESRNSDWKLAKQIRHPLGAQHDAEFASDKPGRSFDSFGRGRHAVAKEFSGRQQAVFRFVEQVAEYLNGAVYAGDFRYVVLLADPTILGILRDKLSAAVAKAVVHEAPKNLANLDESEIREFFE